MPQHLAATVPRGSDIRSRILIAVDDSEYSARALGYVGHLLRDACDVQVTLTERIICTRIFVTLFTWVVVMWASCDESDKLHEAGKPDTSADEHHYRNVA